MKKKYCIIDISGKVPFYEHALCKAINEYESVELCTPYNNKTEYDATYPIFNLIRFFDHKKQNGAKFLKALEGIFNYIYLLFVQAFKRYDVLHFQWFPFLEFAGFERCFLWLYKLITPNTKIILTQHNIYPHNSSESLKVKYKARFQTIDKFIDRYIVHTESSKDALYREFGVFRNKIEVVYHGIFVPDIMPLKTSNNEKMKFLMFGVQSKYKGTDILIDAVAGLPRDILNKIDVTIAGKTTQVLIDEKLELAQSLGIRWEPRFFEDEELNQLIMNSDVLVFPYRTISQSGALLLALAFGKPMIVSKIPSFIETLDGFPEYAFVEVESVESLRRAIINHVNGISNIIEENEVIAELQNKYSWRNSAINTLELYKSIY